MFHKKNTKKPFFNPSQPIDTSSDSPTDMVNKKLKENDYENNSLLDLTQGRYKTYEDFKNKSDVPLYKSSENGYGRTLNVPKQLPAGVVPGPSFNGAVTIGKKCKGNHCSIPVLPTSYNMINRNAQNTEIGNSLNYYPSTYRLGNNSDIIPGITKYTNNGLNSGPFNIDVHNSDNSLEYIVNPKTNRKVKVENSLTKK